MVSGLEGTFKDFKNDWSCGSLPEWIEHLGEVELTYKGTGLCPTCGDSLTLSGQVNYETERHTQNHYARIVKHNDQLHRTHINH